jgi:predicted CXXCH cytochrome family protein
MKLNIKRYHYGVLATIGMGMCLLATPVSAKVTGQCAICHTMHNSQDGTAMALEADGTTKVVDPNDVLLLKGCVACHTGTNDGSNVIPYVTDINEPNYGDTGTEATTNTLAGGSFYWVANGVAGNDGALADSTGHNVATDGMAGQDGLLANVPPGTDGVNPLTAQLRCAGVNGCHGDVTASSDFVAIKGTHHADDDIIDGNSVATSFRFLDGIVGLEDDDWEYQPLFNEHNQYKGVDRTNDTENQTDTISSLCARCHNDFHNGSGEVGGSNPSGDTFASPWVRHPTDFDMGNTAAGSEYRDYGVDGTYVVSAPVASANVDTMLTQVTFSDDSIVTCISCHRAHGSQNADLLRWDYSTVTAGASGTGACFECHTTK